MCVPVEPFVYTMAKDVAVTLVVNVMREPPIGISSPRVTVLQLLILMAENEQSDHDRAD